ncbi:hypothetical protein J6590_062306 [Homalodisca vitripennis]|nr:hypothetical protein J6590_062306 [Homalodisca vitripennis]
MWCAKPSNPLRGNEHQGPKQDLEDLRKTQKITVKLCSSRHLTPTKFTLTRFSLRLI